MGRNKREGIIMDNDERKDKVNKAWHVRQESKVQDLAAQGSPGAKVFCLRIQSLTLSGMSSSIP